MWSFSHNYIKFALNCDNEKFTFLKLLLVLFQGNSIQSVNASHVDAIIMETLPASDVVIVHGNSHPELANLIAG